MAGWMFYTNCLPIDEGTTCRTTCYPQGPVGSNLGPVKSEVSWQSDEGLEIVLTPIQMAAIFNSETVEEDGSIKERVLGAVTVVGGALELIGAAALFATPEPTAVTKVAGVALGAHGIDTASTGLRQIVSGKSETSFTAESVKSAALALGVEDRNATLIGLTVDMGIPLLIGFAGAARALAIRRGAISLVAEESVGGHTIARHVGRTEAQLRVRLAMETKIKAATTFHTLSEAERVVADALRANHIAIKAWSKSAAIGQTKAFAYDAGKIIGFGVVRTTNAIQNMSKVAVVIRKIQSNGKLYFVLTAYPRI